MAQTSSKSMRSAAYLPYLLVILGLSTPLFQLVLGSILETSVPFPMNRFLSLWIFWIIAGIILFISVKVEGIPLSTFGIGRNQRSLRYRLIEMIGALLLGLLLAIVLFLFSNTVRENLNIPSRTLAINLENVLPFWVTLPAWITAAFMEELLFRSYPIERLNLVTGKPLVAGIISAILFAVLHLYGWDWVHVLTLVLPASFIITGIYLWRRSLWFVMVIHAVINLPILFLPFIAPYM